MKCTQNRLFVHSSNRAPNTEEVSIHLESISFDLYTEGLTYNMNIIIIIQARLNLTLAKHVLLLNLTLAKHVLLL